MRKLEIKMIELIKNQKAGFCGDNTFVDIVPVTGAMGNDADKYCAEIVLHNTTITRLFICKKSGNVLSYSFDHGGWRTNTTKSRLNALASAFGLDNVAQKAGVWWHNGERF